LERRWPKERPVLLEQRVLREQPVLLQVLRLLQVLQVLPWQVLLEPEVQRLSFRRFRR
jgi:hypothetical protein